MKAFRALLITAAVAASLAAVDASAQHRGGSGARGTAYSGGHGGGGHWSGGGHGGGGHYYGGGRYYGGHYHGGGGWYGSFYWGFPFYWPSAYWGWGYPYYGYYGYPYYDYYYPRAVPVDPAYVPGEVLPPTTEVPLAQGAPTQGPLYMNYCESAKAYFPKVTECPEGWRFIPPNR